jgi:hypothetical protein
MAKDREPPTIVDYVVTGLSPALIMALVGSLAFFLLEVLYAGRYTGRLQWTLFFFVFGSVLVSRIAIAIDPGRAWLYGLALAGAVFLAMMQYMDYAADSSLRAVGPLINLAPIVVVWWSANKLTWDCTFLDETAEDAGQGLLEELREEMQADDPSRKRQRREEDSTSPVADASSSDRTKKRRPMGRWVIFFSLAALPLFGLGQSLIPADDAGRRRYAFWLMTVYVASGLGLLLTTCLLAMRRYLRHRRLQMPAAMTGLWLGTGAGLILLFLLAGTFLPRPHSEYPLVNLTPVGSQHRGASQHALKGGDPGKGEGRPGADGKDDAAKDGEGGKGQPGGKAQGKSGRPEGSGKGKGKAGGQSKSDQKADGSGKDGKADDRQNGDDRTDSTSSTPDLSPPNVIGAIANVAKWIIVAVLAILAAGVVLWLVLRHFADAFDWARRLLDALSAFWRSLFGSSAPVSKEAAAEVEVVQKRPRPFADFRNPFADGSAAGRSPEELVRYSFAALEAWAFEQDRPRRADETPLEFAARLAAEVPALAADAGRLTALYAQMAYARRRLLDACRAQVEQFWHCLEAAHEQPLPA